MRLISIILFCSSCLFGRNDAKFYEYANSLKQNLSRSCMYGFGVSNITSYFNQDSSDRLWVIKCHNIPIEDNCTKLPFCKWTSKLNFHFDFFYSIIDLLLNKFV